MTQPPKTNLELSFGACGIPKRKFNFAKGIIANPDECGEDSFCIADTEELLVLGVADGVSGSSDFGGNPAALARSLMHNSSKVAKKSAKKFKPHKVLRKVFEKIIAEKDEKLAKGAASTACLVSINKTSGRLKYGNLGDSGFIILSPNEGNGLYYIKFKSEYQLYEFNFPYQFSLYSDGTGDIESLEKIGKNTQNLVLKSGDVLLLMTDGVFDNLFDEELEKLTDKIMKTTKSAQQLAESIGQGAKYRSLDGDADTPFTEGSRECGKDFYGGKEDDITVLAVIVNN